MVCRESKIESIDQKVDLLSFLRGSLFLSLLVFLGTETEMIVSAYSKGEIHKQELMDHVCFLIVVEFQ
jgi:hypothetical protein